MFKPLTKQQIADVVRLQLDGVAAMLKKQGVSISFTPQAVEYIADVGFDPEFGARPVKRAIQHLLLNDLSKRILAGDVDNGKEIMVDSFGDGLVFRN